MAPKPPKVRKINDANPFAALLDFNFSSFATPGLVKIVYLLAVVLGVLAWLGYIVGGFASGDVADTGPLLGILAIILGWIPLLLWIFVVRIGLELAIAVVRTSEDMRHIRAQSSEDSSND